MSDDLDRLLRTSLTQVGDEYESARRTEHAVARQRFLERVARRRWRFPMALGAAAAAVIVAGVLVVTNIGRFTREEPTEVAAPPGDARIDLPGSPADVGVLSEDGTVWVALPDEGQVVRIDASTSERIEIGLEGMRPQEIAIGPNRVWVGDPSEGTIVRIDPSTNQVVGDPIDVGESGPLAISVIGRDAVWAVAGNQLLKIRPDEEQVTRIEGVPAPIDVTARFGGVWVLTEGGLVKVDQNTERVLTEEPQVPGDGSELFAAAGAVWIGDPDSNKIVRFDPADGTFGGGPTVVGNFVDMAANSRALWVLNRTPSGEHLLTALSLVNAEPISERPIGGGPVEVSTGADAVWIALSEDGVIKRIDPEKFLEGE